MERMGKSGFRLSQSEFIDLKERAISNHQKNGRSLEVAAIDEVVDSVMGAMFAGEQVDYFYFRVGRRLVVRLGERMLSVKI